MEPSKMSLSIRGRCKLLSRPAKGKTIYILKDAVPCLNVGDLAFNPHKRTNSHWMIEVQQVNTA
jgi:hypothetical protein